MLKSKQGFILRHLGNDYVIIAVGKSSREFNGMIRTNEIGAFMWKLLEKGTTKEQMCAQILEHYEDTDEDIVMMDIDCFLRSVDIALIE